MSEVISNYVEKGFEELRKTIDHELSENDEFWWKSNESAKAEGFKVSSELILGKGNAQIETNDELIVIKKHADLVAHKVFDEMSMLFDKETELSDAFPKEFDVLIDDTLSQEAHLLSWNVEKGHSKVDDNHIVATKMVDLAAYQVLDKMPEFMHKGMESLGAFPKEIVFDKGATSSNKGWAALSFDPGGECLMVANYGLFEKGTAQIEMKNELIVANTELIKEEVDLLVSSCDDQNESNISKVSRLNMAQQLFLASLEVYAPKGNLSGLCFNPGGASMKSEGTNSAQFVPYLEKKYKGAWTLEGDLLSSEYVVRELQLSAWSVEGKLYEKIGATITMVKSHSGCFISQVLS